MIFNYSFDCEKCQRIHSYFKNNKNTIYIFFHIFQLKTTATLSWDEINIKSHLLLQYKLYNLPGAVCEFLLLISGPAIEKKIWKKQKELVTKLITFP